MSIALKLASHRWVRNLRSPNVRCYIGFSRSPRPPVAIRIQYLTPKSEGIKISSSLGNSFEPKPPPGFVLIYHFRDGNTVRFASAIALGLTVAIAFTLVQVYPMYFGEPEAEDGKAEIANETDKSTNENKKGENLYQTLFYSDKSWNEILNSPYPEVNLVGGLVLIVTFLAMRSNVVLWSCRRDNEYITVIKKRFGFGTKAVKHNAGEVVYYPQRKIYMHQLHGQKLLLFPEYFINKDEELMMCIDKEAHAKESVNLKRKN